MAAPKGSQYRHKTYEWGLSLKRAMARRADGNWRTTLDEIAGSVVEAAIGGDREAWQEIANRLDGKPAQSTEITINDGRTARDIPDDELANIAAGSGDGASIPEDGAQEPANVH